MNLNNGDMLHAAMYAGSRHIIKLLAPSIHCCMKHVTIDEIHKLNIDVSVGAYVFFSLNVF